jgi:hypothetical protein
MPFLAPIAAYPVLKYLAYAGWCGLVSRGYNPERRPWRTAWGLGLIRLLIGVAVGSVLTLAGLHLRFAAWNAPAWVAVMIPIRWLEWSALAAIAARTGLRPATILLGADGRLRAWQLGGVVVSFATDLLMIAAAGSFRAMIC